MNYYNEFDPKAAAWLRALIKAGEIPDGVVDERSITEIKSDDLSLSLSQFKQCHFFAGVGGWPLALKLAGWPEDRPVWTGSCPCQPFSVGNVWEGGGKGFEDGRDLWPTWFRIIKMYRPPVLFGEQVASAIKFGWLDRLIGDLAGEAYATGAAVLPACAFGADHERKRLFWGSYAGSEGWEGCEPEQWVPLPAEAPHSFSGDSFARARNAMAGDFRDIRPCDGVSLQLARDEIKGYGNAIVPEVAARFVRAFAS